MAIFMVLMPIKIQAATDDNNVPTITSSPLLTATSGQPYEYIVVVEDMDDDSISYSFTTAPSGMKIVNNTITWQPTSVGIANVALEITDNQGGYDNQTWQISVNAGDVDTIIITPNDRPTIINIGDNKQFSAKLFDKNSNEIFNATTTWSTDEQYGSIDANGLFLAKVGGIGFVAATVDKVKTSVGVVVKDIRDTLVTEDEIEEVAETTQEEPSDDTITSTAATETDTAAPEEETITEEGGVEGEETVYSDNEATEQDAEGETEECNNWPQWLIILMPIIYGVVLFVYYIYEHKKKTPSWWIFPILLTAIALVIFYKYICTGTYGWWPWIVILIGMVLTALFKVVSKKNSDMDDASQTELPF